MSVTHVTVTQRKPETTNVDFLAGVAASQLEKYGCVELTNTKQDAHLTIRCEGLPGSICAVEAWRGQVRTPVV